ncbi:hypothetical protein NQ317_013122, partial [Molorchus minor]
MANVRHILLAVAMAVLLVDVFGAAVIVKVNRTVHTKTSWPLLLRSESSTARLEDIEPCIGSTPCGWAIYNRTNKYYVDYFMKNKLAPFTIRSSVVVKERKKCLRDDEDISIAAYVYRCKIEDPDAENKRKNRFCNERGCRLINNTVCTISKMPIKSILARNIFDSRGNPTVEVDLVTDLGLFRAAVPSGAST